MKLVEMVDRQKFHFWNVEEENVMLGAWGIAEESPINILSDMELAGAVIVMKSYTEEEGPSPNDVVGAWFTGHHDGYFSFDIVVDPTYQRQGVATMMFDAAMADADGFRGVRLLAVNPIVSRMAQKRGFTNTGGIAWELDFGLD